MLFKKSVMMSKYDVNRLNKDKGFDEYRLKKEEVTDKFKKRAYALVYHLKEEINTVDPRKEISSKELEDYFQVSGPGIRKMIRWLRFNGYPIASSSKGYFYAHGLEELDSTIKHLLDRAEADTAVAMSLAETQNKKPEPERVELQKALF